MFRPYPDPTIFLKPDPDQDPTLFKRKTGQYPTKTPGSGFITLENGKLFLWIGVNVNIVF